MKHDKQKIFEQAVKLIPEKRLVFVEDVIALLSCSKSTFYEMYPDGSDELDIIKELLSKNKIDLKVSMRSKWFQSEAPSLQIALYKLVGSDEERKILSTNYNDHTSKDEKIQTVTVYQLPDNLRNNGIEEE